MAYVKEALASYYQQYVELLDKTLHQKNKFTDLLALVEQKTNVKRVYIAQGRFRKTSGRRFDNRSSICQCFRLACVWNHISTLWICVVC